MSDLIAVMDGGVLHAARPAARDVPAPATQFVADFIGESNMLVGSVSEAGGPASPSPPPRGCASAPRPRAPREPRTGPTHLIVRPEHVRIGPDAERAANRYAAEVLEVLYVGDLVKYRVVAETGDELVGEDPGPVHAGSDGARGSG